MKLFFWLIIFFQVNAFADYDWQWLNQLIDSKRITTIENLLAELPSSMREDYVLMYESRSLQKADYQNPRVILHWDSARRILTFNGGPEYKGGNSVEMIQFNEAERKFEFHSLAFAEGKAPVRDQNIQVCSKCHREDSRPNWENYSFWPGAYGSEDDLYTAVEKAELEKFIGRSGRHPRYQHLVNLNDYRERSRNDPFTERIGAHNFKRIARIFAATTDFDKYKYALAGLVCTVENNFEDYFPEGKKPSTDWKPIDVFDHNSYTSKLRYIFESRNISINDIFMNFVVDPKNLLTVPGWAREELVGTISAYDSELQKYVPFTKNDYGGADGFRIEFNQQDCRGLKTKSLEVLTEM